MNIKENTRFPHPILGMDTGDYESGEFNVEFVVNESSCGGVAVEYTVKLEEKSVRELVASGDASIGVYVKCLRTYYNILHQLELKGGRIELENGALLDTVTFHPVVYATSEINDFSSVNLHKEFGNKKWNFQPEAMIAIGERSKAHVGLDKLAPMETIFAFELDEKVPNGQTRPSLEDEKIGIRVNKETRERIDILRNYNPDIMMNSVYLPVVMEVLSAIGENKSMYESYNWYRVFTAKCTYLGIEPGKECWLENAQILLQSPLEKLLKNKEL